MIKLLIVEDEYFEREFIVSLLQREYEGRMILTQTARDGFTAVEIARVERPDIILMDINIPKMDGLEAARQIRESLPDVIIIFLTAYSSFQYAQQAINVGAKRYLLKPYEDQEIILILEEAIAEVADKRQIKMTGIAQRDMMRYMSDVLEKELICDIIASGNSEKALQYVELLSLEKCSTCFCVGVLSFSTPINVELFKMSITNVFSQVIGTVFGNRSVFFVFPRAGDVDINEHEAEDIVRHALKKQGAEDSKIFLSDCHPKDQMVLCYQEMSKKMSQKRKASEPAAVPFEKNLFVLETRLIKDFFSHDISLVENGLHDIEMLFSEGVAAPETVCEMYREYCKQLYLSCCKQVMQTSDIELHMEDILWDFGHIDETQTVSRTGEVLEDLIRSLFNLMEQNQAKEPNRVANELRLYIQRNYMRNITLNDAAKALNFSYGYLSRCFNRAYGLKFNDYLLTVRIEKAKELINISGKSLSEIAYETGFADPSYFGKTFKKIVGVSPKQYRES